MNTINENAFNAYTTNPKIKDKIKLLSEKQREVLLEEYQYIYNQDKDINTSILDSFIEIFIDQYIIKGLTPIKYALDNNTFLHKINDLNEEQVKRYTSICRDAKIGALLYNTNILNSYVIDDHLTLCEEHLKYGEDPFMLMIIEIACRHKARILYITKSLALSFNSKGHDIYINNTLLADSFYNITSDFERLVILNAIAQTEDIYEKSIIKYFATKKEFNTKKDIYYLLSLVKGIMSLKNHVLKDQLILELNNNPSLVDVYSPNDLILIITETHNHPSSKKYFFNPLVISHLTAEEIIDLYSLYKLNNETNIEGILIKIIKYLDDNQNPYDELKKAHNIANEPKNSSKESPTKLVYKNSSNGQWIDAQKNNPKS